MVVRGALAGFAVAFSVWSSVAANGAVPVTVAPEIMVKSLHLAAPVDAGARICDISADLFVPFGVDRDHPAPAIITTSGFGGTKADQAPFAESFADRGYVVLTYSGLGFGDSGCTIGLDHPDHDGAAVTSLVSFLGGAEGIGFADAAHTQPVSAPDLVRRDAVDHDGIAQPNDPRVGMFGGSYGGEVQFAAAAQDHRIDAIVPAITWNDLSYSLFPNAATRTDGVSAAVGGAAKLWWGAGLGALGILGPVDDGGYQADPSRLLPCPNFAAWVCPTLFGGLGRGFPTAESVDALRAASVSSYADRVVVPTLLMQGQGDTLFDLAEADATYRTLLANGTDVSMIWQSWGHGKPAQPGEWDQDHLDRETQYEAGRVIDWFAHYLADDAVDPGPRFSYFRDWIEYDGNAAPAYAESDTVEVSRPQTRYLGGSGDMVIEAGDVGTSSATFTTTGLGVPTSSAAPNLAPDPTVPTLDLPGTAVSWDTATSADPLTIVGAPRLQVRLRSDRPVSADDADATVVFARLSDVAPDGTATVINALVSPIRVLSTTEPISVTLPPIVHRIAPGHRLRLTLSGSDFGFRGSLVPRIITVDAGPDQALTLPVVDGA